MNRKLLNYRYFKLNNRYFEPTLKVAFLFIFGVLLTLHALGQTCTLSGTGTINWDNTTRPGCQGGVNPNTATVIVIPSGVTLDFNNNGDTWTGIRIEVLGTLRISAPGPVTINSSILVKTGGLLRIDNKLSLGGAEPCNYNLIIETGATVDIVGGSSDRLDICGNEIARGGTGGCNPYPAGPPSYCEPTGGFTGPVGFDEDGVNAPLPVTWLYFNAKPVKETVELSWATTMEKNTARFILERSFDGSIFQQIGDVDAVGESQKKQTYSFIDTNPIVGRTFYRLKEVDFDGYTEYFPKTASVMYDGNRRVLVSPNPSDQGSPLNIGINFTPDESSYFIITDMTGLQVFESSFQGINYNADVRLNSGSYILKLRSGNNSYMTRFVVR